METVFKLRDKQFKVISINNRFHFMECAHCRKILASDRNKLKLPKYVVCDNKRCEA